MVEIAPETVKSQHGSAEVARAPAHIVRVGLIVLAVWMTLCPEALQERGVWWMLGALLTLTIVRIGSWRTTSHGPSRAAAFPAAFPAAPALAQAVWIGWAICWLTALVGIGFSQYPFEARHWALRCLVPGAIIFCCVHQLGRREMSDDAGLVKSVLVTLFVCGFLAALLGIFELLARVNPLYEIGVPNMYYQHYLAQGRVMSTRSSPAVLGSFLVACLPVALTWLRTTSSRIGRPALVGGIGCLVVALTATFSRGALLAAVVTVGVYAVLCRRRTLWLWLVGTVVAVVATCSLVQGPPAQSRLSLDGVLAPNPYRYRMERLRVAIRMAAEHPWAGIGLNHYRLRFREYTGYDWNPISENIYIAFLAETGLVGFGGWAVFVVALLASGARTLRLAETKERRLWLTALYCSIVGLLCNSLTYDTIYWTSVLTLFWTLCGLLTAESLRGDGSTSSRRMGTREKT